MEIHYLLDEPTFLHTDWNTVFLAAELRYAGEATVVTAELHGVECPLSEEMSDRLYILLHKKLIAKATTLFKKRHETKL
jgi:hypothetical protein